ncbi:MAG: hypothetical protein COV66_06285 [Nitrospinae bacterium CG11_big_fil_rev_8_21_14_0_20_45_15]|nr:MAG: hypothetical protein COV66_06285 [Nitrospinae bacterium CG11_big_fil_rev_8_21_14_0_20_45_15]
MKWKRSLKMMEGHSSRLLILLGLTLVTGASSLPSVALSQESQNLDEIKKHPFMLPTGIYLKGLEPKEEVEELFLEAIVTFDDKKQAVINGNNYSVGDLVLGRKLVGIYYNRVSLEENGQIKDIIIKSLRPDSQRFSLTVKQPE